jgi:tetratricopeptide (TPR) repeat protein
VLAAAPASGWKSFGWWKFHFVSNHLAYFAIAGFLASAAGLLNELAAKRRALATAIAVISTAALAILAHQRVLAWGDPERLLANVRPTTHPLDANQVKADWLFITPGRERTLRKLLEQLGEGTGSSTADGLFHILVTMDAREGRLELARKHAEEAVRRRPDHLESLITLGTVQEMIGDNASAKRTYQKALAIRDRTDVLEYLSLLAAKEGDLQTAASYLKRAASIDPEDPGIHLNLGRIRLRSGDRAGAAEEFRAALAMDADNGAAKEGLRLATQ